MKRKVLWEMFKQFWHMRFKEKEDFIVVDIPNLYEAGLLSHIMYPIIVVGMSNINENAKRIMLHTGVTQK